MPKYYKTMIEVTTVFQAEVVADNEESARNIARGLDTLNMKPQSRNISRVVVEFDGECDFDIGTQVEHEKFGKGVITEVNRVSGGYDEKGYSAQISFESGKELGIHMTTALSKGVMKIIHA